MADDMFEPNFSNKHQLFKVKDSDIKYFPYQYFRDRFHKQMFAMHSCIHQLSQPCVNLKT